MSLGLQIRLHFWTFTVWCKSQRDVSASFNYIETGPGQSRTKSIMMFLSIYCEGEAFQMDSWPNIVALILFCLCTVQHILIGGAAFNTFAIGWPSDKPQKPACDVNPPVLNKHDFSKCLQLRLCAFSPTHVRDERGRICVTVQTRKSDNLYAVSRS